MFGTSLLLLNTVIKCYYMTLFIIYYLQGKSGGKGVPGLIGGAAAGVAGALGASHLLGVSRTGEVGYSEVLVDYDECCLYRK